MLIPSDSRYLVSTPSRRTTSPYPPIARPRATEVVNIVESSDDAIISANLDGMIASWNPAAERLYGYPKAEAIGQPMDLILPSLGVAEADQILKRIAAGEHIDPLETVQVRRDHSNVDVLMTVSPIRMSGGAIVGVAVIAHEIS